MDYCHPRCPLERKHRLRVKEMSGSMLLRIRSPATSHYSFNDLQGGSRAMTFCRHFSRPWEQPKKGALTPKQSWQQLRAESCWSTAQKPSFVMLARNSPRMPDATAGGLYLSHTSISSYFGISTTYLPSSGCRFGFACGFQPQL